MVATRVSGIVIVTAAFIVFNVAHMIWKVLYYTRVKWRWFLIDFCYWNNAMVTFLLAGASSPRFAALAYIHATGPVYCAIVLWGNKIFLDPRNEEDWELLSSTAFHALPAVCLYLLQWHADGPPPPCFPVALGAPAYVDAMAFFVAWQVLYVGVQCAGPLARRLDADPALMTTRSARATASKRTSCSRRYRRCTSEPPSRCPWSYASGGGATPRSSWPCSGSRQKTAAAGALRTRKRRLSSHRRKQKCGRRRRRGRAGESEAVSGHQHATPSWCWPR